MARRTSKKQQRKIAPDSVYGDEIVSKFINCMMWSGKKGTAERLFYGALDRISQKAEGESNGYETFRKALENVSPVVEVRSRRVGGVTYQVPVTIRPERRTALAIRWLIHAARKRNEHGMSQKLANEIMDAAKGSGSAMKKKEDTRKMADANRAFSHYRW